ncbi:hypothetical protein [Stappia sp.]|uniref:hypothetical protein n=1 Tax=Stappia sp. TaxID=1870903 RepID=UPI003C7E8A94
MFAVLVGIDLYDIAMPLWWNDVAPLATNMLAGGLVSFFFYWLVVYEPERRKRHLIKTNLSKMYSRIKEGILYQIVFASQKGGRIDLEFSLDTIDRLLTVEGFKDTFSGGREANEGFYAFENQMMDNTREFREIVLYLDLLARQIEFVLHNYNMDDEHLFDFFKRLELLLLRLRHSTPGYDESKPLCSFIYEIFAGWNPIEGYMGYDLIDKMITDI